MSITGSILSASDRSDGLETGRGHAYTLRPTTEYSRGCSSVVERHVANVNVEGSTPFTRLENPSSPDGFFALLCSAGRKVHRPKLMVPSTSASTEPSDSIWPEKWAV